jgi:hypothetical protein
MLEVQPFDELDRYKNFEDALVSGSRQAFH